MAQFHKSPEHKHSEYSDHAYVSPIQNLKNLSSGGLHPKGEQNKSTNNLVSDQSMTDNLGSDNSRQFSGQGPPRYRITTSTGSMRSPGPHTRGGENRANVVYGEGRGYLDSFGAPSIRGITGSGEKEAGGKAIESKYMKIDKERLYEEGIQLKRQLNALQDENTKLKTRNVHLEKEAVKFEKMFQEVSTNPNKKKNKQTAKSEGLDVPTLKQHIRDLKSELDDRDSELTGLKKKAKVTKIHELEVQLQALQDETLKLRSYAEAIMAKKTDNIIQEGEKHLVRVQNAESIRLKKELDALQHANRTYELKCQDYQSQLASKEEKFKRDQANSNRMIQNKERELVKLRSQLVGYTATASANAEDKNKGVDKKGQIKKDVEKMTAENRNLKTNLEEKDSEIVRLEKQLKEIEANIEIKPSSPKEFLLGKPEHQEHAHHPHIVTPKEAKHELKEEEVKKVINNPSYETRKSPREEPKKEQVHHAPAEKKETKEVKEAKEAKVTKEVKEEKPAPKPVVEKKVSADDAKKIAYHINLSFRVKGVPFEAIEKLDWKKQAQSDGSLNRDQIAKVLKNEIFGLSEKEIAVLAQHLLQENNPKDNKTTDIDGVKATLTGLMGPLPYWDDEMKKKLHSSISKICTEYRETLTEALSLLCNGDYLTRKHLEEAAEAVEVPLNFAQLEYIITKLYERSGDANSLAITDLFEIFYVEEEKESPPVKAGKGGETKPKEAEHKAKGKKDVAETKGKPAKEAKKTISKEEDAYGIYEDDEFDDDDHKLSDEEDGAKYEPLFPPEGEEKHEKITERGEEEEDEEDDEEYKEDDYEEEENKEQVGKQKVETKSKQKDEEEEEEYGDDQYEEEEEQEEEKPKPKPKTKEEVKKSSVSSVPKSSNREEPQKSKQLEEEEEDDYEEPKPKKSVEIAKGKKKTEEDDYEEEYEEEFPEEDDACKIRGR